MSNSHLATARSLTHPLGAILTANSPSWSSFQLILTEEGLNWCRETLKEEGEEPCLPENVTHSRPPAEFPLPGGPLIGLICVEKSADSSASHQRGRMIAARMEGGQSLWRRGLHACSPAGKGSRFSSFSSAATARMAASTASATANMMMMMMEMSPAID